MKLESQAQEIEKLIEWGKGKDAVRAMVLTSTLAIPDAPSDVLSDYDVILALKDVRPFFEQRERTMALFRKTAEEVGEALGYSFPIEIERKVIEYLLRLKNLERGAERL